MTRSGFAGAIGFCLVVVSAAPVPAAADVGRLFFTPAERAALEAARRAAEKGPIPESTEPETIVERIEIEPAELKPTITIDGYVRRSNGRATLWVNGENSYDGDLSSSRIERNTARMTGGEIRVTPVGEDSFIRLKPGQSYDPNSTTTTDVYEAPALAEELARH